MKKKIAAGLLIAGIILMAVSTAVYGVGFILLLTGAAFAGISFMIWLTMPFKNRRTEKLARVLFGVLAFLIAIGAASFIWIETLIIKGPHRDAEGDADILIVLGAGLRGSTPSAILTSRLNVTYDYMKNNPRCIAVLTGGQGSNEDVTEASAMRKYLTDRGIDPDRLILEEKARNTAQNVKYSLALMDDMGLSGHITVVSSEFHLYRAEKLFERFDTDVSCLGAATPKIGLLPLNSYVREYFSVVIMGVKDMFGFDE